MNNTYHCLFCKANTNSFVGQYFIYSFSFKCCQCLINFKGRPYLSNQMNPYNTFKEKSVLKGTWRCQQRKHLNNPAHEVKIKSSIKLVIRHILSKFSA